MQDAVNALLAEGFDLVPGQQLYSPEAVTKAQQIVAFARDKADSMTVTDLHQAAADLTQQLKQQYSFLNQSAADSLVNYIFLLYWR